MFDSLLQIVTPHYCRFCNAFASELCDVCFTNLRRIPTPACYRCNRLNDTSKTCRACRASSPIFALQKLAYYEEPVKSLILAAKINCSRQAARRLGQLMSDNLPCPKPAVVTWVPTAAKRVRYRGYDHAYEIARQLAHKQGLELQHLLIRTTNKRQTGATRHDRRTQMRSEFEVRAKNLIAQHVLLIDDVASTGASAEACAHALRQAGARRVSVLVAAQNR